MDELPYYLLSLPITITMQPESTPAPSRSGDGAAVVAAMVSAGRRRDVHLLPKGPARLARSIWTEADRHTEGQALITAR